MTPHAIAGKAGWRAQLHPECTPEGANAAFIKRLGQAWEATRGVITPNHLEDRISRTLVAWMQLEQRKLNGEWTVVCQPESLQVDVDGEARLVGRCDIVLIVRCHQIIYECKRLHFDSGHGSIKTNATEYIKEGLHRFTVENKYSTFDHICGLIGYIMDGNLQSALQVILSRLFELSPPKSITNPTHPFPCQNSYRFKTDHEHSAVKLLVVHHLLFPVT